MVEWLRPGSGITTTIIGIRIRMSALTYAEDYAVTDLASWQKITNQNIRRWYRKGTRLMKSKGNNEKNR